MAKPTWRGKGLFGLYFLVIIHPFKTFKAVTEAGAIDEWYFIA